MGEVVNIFGGGPVEQPPEPLQVPDAIVPVAAELDVALNNATRCVGCTALESCLAGLKAAEEGFKDDDLRESVIETMPAGVRELADESDGLLSSMDVYTEAVKMSLRLDVATAVRMRAACFGLARTVRHPIKGECGLSEIHQRLLTKLPEKYRS